MRTKRVLTGVLVALLIAMTAMAQGRRFGGFGGRVRSLKTYPNPRP